MRSLGPLSLFLAFVVIPFPGVCQDMVAGPGTTPIGMGQGFPAVSDYYPEAARAMGLEGTTQVLVCVGTDGKLLQKPTIATSSGRVVLDEGGLEFAEVGSGNYQPATKDGQPVASCGILSVTFQADQQIQSQGLQVSREASSTSGTASCDSSAQTFAAERQQLDAERAQLDAERQRLAEEAKVLAAAVQDAAARGAGSSCESGLSIQEVMDDGAIIELTDGSIWKVDEADIVDSALWLAAEDVVVCNGQMIDTDQGETVDVERVK